MRGPRKDQRHIVKSILVTAALLGKLALDSSREALQAQAESQLRALGTTKRTQIEDYFGTVLKQVKTLADDRMTIDAIQGLTVAFASYPTDVSTLAAPAPASPAVAGSPAIDPLNSPVMVSVSADRQASWKAALSKYYNGDFFTRFKERNPAAEDPNMNALLDRIDTQSLALQHSFIAANPNPLGEKDNSTTTG